MKMLKRFTIGIITITLLLPTMPLSAGNTMKMSVDQIVQSSQSYDIDKKLSDMDKVLTNLRKSYTPTGLGGGSWAGTFNYTVGPLLSEVQQASNDYTTLNSEFSRNITHYQNALNYWIAFESLKVAQTNYNLAKKEYEINSSKYKLGLISKNDLINTEISKNKAYTDYKTALVTKTTAMYQLNNNMGQTMITDIDSPQVSFSLKNYKALNITQEVTNVVVGHKSLEPLNKALNTYDKILSIVAGQTDHNVPTDGLNYLYQTEKDYTNYQMTKLKSSLELTCRAKILQLTNLEESITLGEQNIKNLRHLYDSSVKLYELGMITFTDLEEHRLNLLNSELRLLSDKKTYMELDKEFQLFKKGYLPAR